MNIRPHHLLCVQNYVGYGYNDEFTHHMDQIVEALSADAEVTIREGCDDICSACPHNIENTCRSLEKVDRMDNRIVDACGLTYNARRTWKELKRLVGKRIFDDGRFDEICSSCQWYDLCAGQNH
ncbi:MAG: DUF1284 domain-containing protein [Lachnospiraceae bacterium]|nr:DUF1284 domain-containing protein [Lachnospiraceae bacterium]